jgi:uncharacterized membrane protein
VSVTFTTIDVPGAEWTKANGINRHGPLGRSVQIVGTYSDISGTHGFLYSEGHYTRLDVPHGYNTAAYGINGRGQIVGTYQKTPGYPTGPPPHGLSPFLLDSGTYTDLNLEARLQTSGVALYGVNNSGAIVGSKVDEGTEQVEGFACLPTPGGCLGTEPQPVGGIVALYGVNNVGKCVGYKQSAPGVSVTAHGISRQQPNGGDTDGVDAPGAIRTFYRGISDAGLICGYAEFGHAHAFVLGSTFTIFQFPGALWTQANGINSPIPGVADNSFEVVGLYTSAGLNQSHGFVATLSPPHLVKWDGRAFIEQELEEGAMFRQDGRVVPARYQPPQPTDIASIIQ